MKDEGEEDPFKVQCSKACPESIEGFKDGFREGNFRVSRILEPQLLREIPRFF